MHLSFLQDRHKMVAGAVVIGCVVLVLYAATLRMGFYTDDFTYLEYAGRLTWQEYLVQVLDPRTPVMTYRPMLSLLLLGEYLGFRFESSYYHLIQVLLHLGNGVLISGIVWKLSGRWRFALITSLIYVGFPIYGWAVYWVSVHDPLAVFFYLIAVWFWLSYLRSRTMRDYVLTMIAFVFSLLSKETCITAPIVFFLIDRWFVGGAMNLRSLFKRYVAIGIISFAYIALEYFVQSNGIFIKEGNYSFGPQIFSNFETYLVMLMTPWGMELPTPVVWTIAVLLIAMTIIKRSTGFAFVGILVLLNVVPVLAIPWTIQGRYLYFAMVGQAAFIAMIVDGVSRAGSYPGLKWLSAAAVAGLLVFNGLGNANEQEIFSEIARQKRVPFRDITRQYPSLPPDTLLYFIEPPATIPEIQGFFFQRYGPSVLVKGTFEDGMSYAGGRLFQRPAQLGAHAQSHVYYFDQTNRAIELPLNRVAALQINPELPQTFNAPIRLEGYELTSSTVRRGDSFALLLYWTALGKIDKDYTVFVHLVNSEGEILLGDDSFPRNGNERTSAWRPNQFTADAHVISVPSTLAAANNYQIRIGLYDAKTMQRLRMEENNERAGKDEMVIQPLRIVE